jgi:hypothetical protein
MDWQAWLAYMTGSVDEIILLAKMMAACGVESGSAQLLLS